jgi:hypothetical protein
MGNTAIDPEAFRQKLKLKSFEVKSDFSKRYSGAEKLLLARGLDLGKIREHSARILGAGALAGSLMLAAPRDVEKLQASRFVEKMKEGGRVVAAKTPNEILLSLMGRILPEKPRPLEHGDEKQLEKIIGDVTGVKVRATLEGEHLNTTYGLIGAEQHLRRYPGDSLGQHSPDEGDYGEGSPGEVLKEGIAPGLGAWGYFAPSRSELTPELEEIERWYAVVQTLYLPEWSKRQPYLGDWYKYRKVLIVNTVNGKAVVASIADAGPAAWTGKQFGGSPEVMDYLGGARYKKGPVLVFFVDDPDNKVPLGPVEYNEKRVLVEKA